MTESEIFRSCLERLQKRLELLDDKPEETHESTLRALWMYVCDQPLSAQAAADCVLPELTPQQQDRLEQVLAERLDGKPLPHITGRQQFMGLELLASPEALVPRKETELLAKEAGRVLDQLCQQQGEALVVDVCTGAGNLPVALAKQRETARVHASDLSPEAVALAQRNVDLHDLQERISLHEGDLLAPFDHEGFHGRVDLITCNPPYISSAKVEQMPREIAAHEPKMAFDGGAFGVSILERLIRQSPGLLKQGGYLLFEIGLGQGERYVRRMQKKSEFREVRAIEDERGDVRVIQARL